MHWYVGILRNGKAEVRNSVNKQRHIFAFGPYSRTVARNWAQHWNQR